ncbi:APC family permease [Aurantiacibacter rhizosphaerae]|uniref:Amino acid permease n=1 Tax=Aurantiacibacter rhizosphaerae TaxID=2691582 RepID=A0A844X960_9SPHN|nr:APC family permease [Aurantiacibacter rhizosphaerae]MWV26867.1 amino acid permease [Aurantiacibacter rhizosphaerae]
MSDDGMRQAEGTGSLSGSLGAGDIIFMILACAAPMGVLAGIIPLALAFGNGAGMPGTQLLVCGVMMLFAMGYVRMIPHVRNAGAFYAYIALSLNKEAGIAAAYVAVTAYICAAASVIGAMAYFAADLFQSAFGLATRWEIWAAITIAAVTWLGYHKISLAAKVLAIALLLEVGLILLIDIMILYHVGLDGLDFSSFMPTTIFAPGLGIALIYAINGCIGFEASAIYQEEARNPRRNIPRATYGAVLILGTFYVLSSWCLVLAVSPEKIKEVAAADPGGLVTSIAAEYLGRIGREAFSLLTVTSLFAAAIGFFNNIARYIYALSRDGLIPQQLGRIHPRHGSPYVACLLLTVVLTVVIGAFAIAGLDPLLSLTTSLSSMGAVGLEILIAATSLSIPLFFARRGEYSFGKTVAPLTGGLIIAVITYLSLDNYSALTGTDLVIVNSLPLLFLVLITMGLLHGIYLRKYRPDIHASVGSTHVEGDVATPADGSAPQSSASAAPSRS